MTALPGTTGRRRVYLMRHGHVDYFGREVRESGGMVAVGDVQFEDIDWSATERAMSQLPLHRRRWVTKHVTGICGVAKCMHRWGKREDDKCCRCGESEDAVHVWKCRTQETDALWEKAMDELATWLRDQVTAPAIIRGITVVYCSVL